MWQAFKDRLNKRKRKMESDENKEKDDQHDDFDGVYEEQKKAEKQAKM